MWQVVWNSIFLHTIPVFLHQINVVWQNNTLHFEVGKMYQNLQPHNQGHLLWQFHTDTDTYPLLSSHPSLKCQYTLQMRNPVQYLPVFHNFLCHFVKPLFWNPFPHNRPVFPLFHLLILHQHR